MAFRAASLAGVQIIYGFSRYCLQERADIRDENGVKPLKLDGGCIEFDNVHFR